MALMLPEYDGMVLVLRGTFNPAILHPLWFVSAQLLRREEAEAAEIQVVHPQVADFTAAKIGDRQRTFST
jgi:hypothetical protein